MKKTLKKIVQNGLDLFFRLHHKTSSFTAKIIGPTVFNYGTKEKNWNLSTSELLQFPQGSLGNALGQFLKKSGVEPLAGAEYHDVQHVLLDYSISFKDEVALQFFLHGNGKRSIASVSTMIGAWCILPTQWKYLKASYKRGENSKDISALSLKTLLGKDLNQVKRELFNEETCSVQSRSGLLNVNWQ
jgi:ubiquinone biosynthesis protein Coq4